MPAKDPHPQVVTLGKTTRIRASRHSLVLLKFPEDVSLRELSSRIEGGGRVAGFALTNQTQSREEGGFLVQSLVFNRCIDPGCPAAKQPLQVRYAEGLTNGVIPAGTYRLYVIADRASVEITFRHRYLQGDQTVRLTGSPVDIDLRTLRMSPAATNDGTVFSGGDFTTLQPGRGIGMLGLWALGPNYLGGAFGNCFYFDETLVPSKDTAFLPGCPAGWAPSRNVQGPAPAGKRGGIVYKTTHHRLPQGIGGWAASAATIDDFGAVGLWLRF